MAATIINQNLIIILKLSRDTTPIERVTHDSVKKNKLWSFFTASDLCEKLVNETLHAWDTAGVMMDKQLETQLENPNTPLGPCLSPEWIDPHASGIVKALQKSGFTSYLVGGCVRDLLLGFVPKDFDIATMAHPPQVKRLIHMAFVIGKRFRLVLVKRGDQQFEVATFRKEFDPSEFPAEEYPDGPPSAENVFGTPEEDAKRRDFTINALFYDPISHELIDYVGGKKDIEEHRLRMIGAPDERLIEDPIRILRAVRITHKLRFTIESDLRNSIQRKCGELKRSVLPRRREELLKILRLKEPVRALAECHDLGILREIFPSIERMYESPERAERFGSRLELYRPTVRDFSNTNQVFTWLIATLLDTLKEESLTEARSPEDKAPDSNPDSNSDPSSELMLRNELSSDAYSLMVRDELGLYKFEQGYVSDTLKLRHSLTRTADLKRRGDRRLLGLLRREGYPQALALLHVDLRLSGDDLLFFNSAESRLESELDALAVTKGPRRPSGARRSTRRRTG